MPQADSSLSLSINAQQQLELQDKHLSLELNLNDALRLLAVLNEQLNLSQQQTNKVLEKFYNNLLMSFSLLGTHQRQQLLAEASLPALGCLLKRFHGQPAAEFIRANLSQRRLSQAEEEASFLDGSLKLEQELGTVLAPFYAKINAEIQAAKLSLPDPKGIYFS